MFHSRTVEAAKGKWRGILLELGVPDKMLINKHGPCPLCGGTDRFRFDNKMGSGSWFCNSCGSGDGIELAQRFIGEGFRETADKIDRLTGNIKPDPASSVVSDIPHEERRQMLRATYAESKKIELEDVCDHYLAKRKVNLNEYPTSLRFAPALKDGEGGVRPCMLAIVSDILGKPISMHRTFLQSDGSGKAEMASPRKMMPGSLPDGACVRLTDGAIPRHLGIAEGIETALAAAKMFKMPVWSVINTAGMKKWKAPTGVEKVTIFGDNDLKFGGQAAAYELAHKLSVSGIRVKVEIPEGTNQDWNDVHMGEQT